MTSAIWAEADALQQRFIALGASPVEADILMPAETLLDLYGEDIRARAFVTSDPFGGEMVLRPDFTVSLVQQHMTTRASPARYTYSGKVFRKQETDPTRAREYVQVGFEVFDGDTASADAAVFAAISAALDGLPVRAVTGDIGILRAAVMGLRTTDARRAALLRHLWRPKRFRALLDRYCGRLPVPPGRAALLADPDPMARAQPDIGKRSRAEIAARIAALQADAAAPPISTEERAQIEAILALRETLPHVLSALRDIAVDLPAISRAVHGFDRRIAALAAAGIAVDTLGFEGSYGRTTLEYYDGFVFGFTATDDATLPPVATGGRYDTLTAQLGESRAAPAVGAVIRPDLVLRLRGEA